ncbi:hypothetical protein [Dactylosporangium sp. NPDC005555]|uniref:hypothetical protein n=1 Tax=Dactylosporangium sp. NPDC005555 TaxID=3154889 RepID=UPI0033A2BEE7
MTDDLTQALSRLRADVGSAVAPPTGAQVRRRAERRLRTRRTATALGAAAVVGAVLVGGGLIWNGGASQTPPPLPGGSDSPSHTGTPSAAARPSRPVDARQTPQAPADWAGVDWATATVTLPAQQGCPSGPVTLRKQDFNGVADMIMGPATGWPKVSVDPRPVVYGDLTADGQPEAVLHATCWQTEEDSGDGQGQLLVVRRDGATLRAVGWVGPRGAIYADRWIDNGRLVTDVKPWHTGWDYALGAARAFRWTGQAFTEVDSGLPGIVTPLDLSPVAGLTGCPAPPEPVRFDAEQRATAAGTTWDLFQPTAPDSEQHLVDLDGDGTRRLLVSITCGRTDKDPGHGFVAVLDGSLRAIDAVRPPEGTTVAGWSHVNGLLTLLVYRPGEATRQVRYTWNGDYFQR